VNQLPDVQKIFIFVILSKLREQFNVSLNHILATASGNNDRVVNGDCQPFDCHWNAPMKLAHSTPFSKT